MKKFVEREETSNEERKEGESRGGEENIKMERKEDELTGRKIRGRSK